ncbi:MAG: (d)CMP kinase [Caulobacteraceae bacterium]
MNNKVIAIDGPAGAGKSTIARKLADMLGYTYVDSGAMYRALTLKLLKEKVNFRDTGAIITITEKADIDFINNSIYLDGVIVDREIREEDVNRNVSCVAAIPEVRRIMVDLQRKVSKNKNVVMDGRDVGTVIFPEADYKFFITASVQERAERRYKEILQRGYSADINDIKAQIENRDHIDSTRCDSPLKKADNAICIETTGKNIDEVMREVLSYI